ncbi:MAG: hypothetical protein NTW78_03830 [Campylobacterales bacterium]|nr:hypothetical protein [Campylobacterales bacterium]
MAEWYENLGTGGIGGILGGVGALAGAWGSYENSKENNKLKKQQFDYEVNKDNRANTLFDKQQKSLDDAWTPLTPTIVPKKKNADGTDTIDTTALTA